jgi:hypothetical protein
MQLLYGYVLGTRLAPTASRGWPTERSGDQEASWPTAGGHWPSVGRVLDSNAERPDPATATVGRNVALPSRTVHRRVIWVCTVCLLIPAIFGVHPSTVSIEDLRFSIGVVIGVLWLVYWGLAYADENIELRTPNQRQVEFERERLLREIRPDDELIDLLTELQEGVDRARRAREEPAKTDDDSEEVTKLTRLLIDYYAHALAHAKDSARTSRRFSILGITLLFAGLGVAMWRAGSNGSIYLSLTSSASGVITTAISLLFQRDARQALAHLEGQTDKLRQDSAARRQMARALRLLDTVLDAELKDQLRAGLIVKLASAQLGDFPLPPNSGAVRRP